MALWLYLHFPSLQLDSLYAGEHVERGLETHNENIVIINGQRNEITQLNQHAEEQGLKRGMGLATAASLCPKLQVKAYNESFEIDKLKEIAQWLYLVTSDISLFKPDGVLLRADNMLTLYDGLEHYWQNIKAQLQTFPYLRYHFASAFSPWGARLLARMQWNQVSQDEQLTLNAIKACPLSATELSAKQVLSLQKVGVHDLNTLLSLSTTELNKRFDASLVNYIGRLKGHFHHPISFFVPPEQFNRYLDLLFEIEHLNLLEKPLLKLLAQLEAYLRMRNHYAYELQLTLSLRDDSQQIIHATSAAGEYLKESWLKLFQLRMESVRVTTPITRIVLCTLRTAAITGETNDLFAGRQGRYSARELLSLLQAKLGEQAVHSVRLTEDPRPDLNSQACMPLLSRSYSSTNSSTASVQRDPSLLRPSILLPTPQPLREQVSLVHGPERIATGWWDRHAMIRDYFIARSANGSWLWIYRTPEQLWYLHGVFS